MNFFVRYLRGYHRIRFFSSSPEKILDYAIRQNLPAWGIRREGDAISFFLFSSHRKHLKGFFSTLSAEERWEEERQGFWQGLSRFGPRFGFFLGAVLFSLSLYFSQKFVWSVEVSGNVWIPEWEIQRELEEMGVSPGKRKSSIDPTGVALKLQVEDPRFSFVSLNLIGTKAMVEVRERETFAKEAPEEGMCNMVAKVSGRILRYEVLEGKICVQRGTYVPKGALLISGVIENKNGTLSTVRAKGRVFAETERIFEVSVPLAEKGIFYSGREAKERKISILGFSFSLPGDRCSFDRAECMTVQERLTLFGKELPILYEEKIYLETEEKIRTLTVDRAGVLAYDKYEEYKRDTFAKDAKILQETVQVSSDEKQLTLRIEILAEEDVCQALPFNCVTLAR